MNLTTSTLDPLMNWVTTTRAMSRQLDHQADSLLVSLQRLKSRARRVTDLSHQPLTLGFYGHAQAGKNSLLTALQCQQNTRVEIILGDKSLDYLTHINPGNIPPVLAVRFTQTTSVELSQYPLRLALFSECELVHQFMLRYQQGATPRMMAPSLVAQRVTDLACRRLPEPVSDHYEADVAVLLLDYRRLQRRDARFDDTLNARICELAPRLSLNDRAELFSLLWGEDSSLTEQWLQRAQLLEQLGHPQHVLAPASLIVDSFLLPTEGFLTPANPHSPYPPEDVLVCSLIEGMARPPLSIAQRDLVAVCAEVILTQKPGATLADADLLDIPLHQLDYFTRRLQPDILLICNAVNNVREIQATGNALGRWIDSTQITGNGNPPPLIWAITSSDSRFKNGVNLDEGVQRRVGPARVRWGILQAQDSRNMHLLHDWLQETLTPERKIARLTGLNAALETQARALFHQLITHRTRTPQQERQQAEDLVRSLQTHVLQLGSLLSCLVPSREALTECWLQNHQQQSAQPDPLGLNIDLFADDSQHETISTEDVSYAHALHRLWINHLRAPLLQADMPSWGLEPEQWHLLSEILIVASYRLALPELLESVSNEPSRELAVARSHSALGDFVAWLGYASTPYAQRPLSRINKQQAIFAPARQVDMTQRLSKLGEQPQPAHISYAYDWLVALYNRATENIGYQPPQAISEHHHQQLLTLLD